MLKEQIENYLYSYVGEQINEETNYQLVNGIMFLIRKEIDNYIVNKDEYKNIKYSFENYSGHIVMSMYNLYTASIFFGKYIPYNIISEFEQEGKFIYPDGEILEKQGDSYLFKTNNKIELINIDLTF